MAETKRLWWLFLLIFVAVFFLYSASLNYYFFQDDWFVLNWIRTESLFKLFAFRTDIIYWRPISMPIFFLLNKSFWGLNPLGFHLIAFLFHFINIFLVYLLLKKFKVSEFASFFGSFLYGTASFQFIPLSWLSTTSYIIGPTFIFLSILNYRKKFLSLLFFVLALTSSELGLIVIPLSFLLKNESKKKFAEFLPFLLIGFAYLFLRFLVFPLPQKGDYLINFSPKILSNFFWYVSWFFNIPEKISTIFFFSNLKVSLLNTLPFFKYLISPMILGLMFFAIIFNNFLKRQFFLGIIWFVVSLSPILFLPKHVYPMYLVIASVGPLLIISKSIDKLRSFKRSVILAFAAIWYLSSFLTIQITKETHWLVNEQAISGAYSKYLRTNIPSPAKNSYFLFRPADLRFSRLNKFVLVEGEDNVKHSLNDQDALQVLYNNSNLRSIFATYQEKTSLPEEAKVYEISPKVK